jgi:hypothetical protein
MRVLSIVRHLAGDDIQVLSPDRLNLFSGTNEPDHEQCVPLRETLSRCLVDCHGKELGAISSDIVFHVSEARDFGENLSKLINRPRLWNHMCFSIDEQVPFRDGLAYERYLEGIAAVWRTIKPALRCELEHAKDIIKRPRVIVNMLVPDPFSSFRPEHRWLYPGGPARATRWEELVERYVSPFCGGLEELAGAPPADHRFTTGYGKLRDIRGSWVYLARCWYMPTGRGKSLILPGGQSPKPKAAAIRTKLLPVGDNRFSFRACFTTGPASEDELPVPPMKTPPWFAALAKFVIDVRRL